MKIFISLLLTIFLSFGVFVPLFAQDASKDPKPADDLNKQKKTESLDSQDKDGQNTRPPRSDLPFPVNESKRLSVRYVDNKKEGGFFTGLPLINSDPNVGIGYGVRVIYTNNGERKNPLFEYTPYRYQIFAQYFNTTKSAQFHWARLDAPYIFDTQWRLRLDAIMDRNPNTLYFGFGEATLRNLSFKDYQAYGQPFVENATFGQYEEGLRYRRPGIDPTYQGMVTNYRYNRYDLETPNFNASVERSFFGGVVRTVAGVRFSRQVIRTFEGQFTQASGPFFADNGLNNTLAQSFGTSIFSNIPTQEGASKLREDARAGVIRGTNGGYTNTLRLGLVYDTRDFEPNPNKGLFLEATHERAMKVMGSDYEFNRNYASARVFWSPFQGKVEQLVFAGRAAFVSTKGDAPFYEYRNMWSTDGQISGLGGRTTLRGYKQDRFIGPAMAYSNLEIRWKFWGIKTSGGSTFDFQLVPFFDIGRVWDKVQDANLKNYKFSQGIGLRIPWNQSTIIYIDHAWSREDRQTFINFMHIF